MPRRSLLLMLALLAPSPARGDDAPAKPARNSADEPLAESFSLERGARFLDAVSSDWTHKRKCVTCHTNLAHVMAGPIGKNGPSPALAEARAFFEGRVAGWERPGPGSHPIGEGEAVAVSTALVFNDLATTGTLHPRTRAALDRMWTTQRPDGGWNWFDCDYPPLEDDDYYGAALASLAVGHAPDDYQAGDSARAGLAKLRDYLRANPPPNLHHRALLLWSSTKLDGLMPPAERDRTVADLLALQRPDGGWSLPSLIPTTVRDRAIDPATAPSDGYGTGYVTTILRQSGQPADAPPIRRAVAWLKAHQRASGRWFTRSPSAVPAHYLTHVGTGYALMALKACGEE